MRNLWPGKMSRTWSVKHNRYNIGDKTSECTIIIIFFCNRVIIFLRYYLGCTRHRVVYGENVHITQFNYYFIKMFSVQRFIDIIQNK